MQEFTNGNSLFEELFYEQHNKIISGKSSRYIGRDINGKDDPPPDPLDPRQIRKSEGVYVIASGCGETIKVGRTTNVASRLKTLQTSHAYPLHLVKFFVCQDSRRLEMLLHLHLDRYRMMGEWFQSLALGDLQNLNFREMRIDAYEFKGGAITLGDTYDKAWEPAVPIDVKLDIDRAAHANGVNRSRFVRVIFTNWAAQPEPVICRLPSRGNVGIRMRTNLEQKALIDTAAEENDSTAGQIIAGAMHLYKEHTDPTFTGWDCAPVITKTPTR